MTRAGWLAGVMLGCAGEDDRRAEADVDGDGHDSLDAGGDDCDDANARIHPGADDRCNGLDDDCSGVADDGPGSSTFHEDRDGDGFAGDGGEEIPGCRAPDGFAAEAGDCDDADPDRSPTAPDPAGDGVDQDCDGTDGTDADGDGVASDTDCDDADPAVFPGARERLGDGLANDCDGEPDVLDLRDADPIVVAEGLGVPVFGLAGDFDADGLAELVVGGRWVVEAPFGEGLVVPADGIALPAAADAIHADVDGDGAAQLGWAHGLWLGDPVDDAKLTLSQGRLVVGDVVGGPAVDAVSVQPGGLFVMEGPLERGLLGVRRTVSHLGLPSGAITEVAVGDVNGDGAADLVVADLATVAVAWGPLLGDYAALRDYDLVVDEGGSTLALADLDADGILEVVAARDGTLRSIDAAGRVDLVLDAGATGLATVGDANGDGCDDLLVEGGPDARVLDGCALVGSPALDAVTLGRVRGGVRVVPDLDGDGGAELVLAESTGGYPPAGVRVGLIRSPW